MLAWGEECAFGDAGFLHGDHLRRANGTVMAIKKGAKGRPRKQGSFGLYREGKATPEILFTVQVVLTARRWRALLDEQLRPIGQSSARMEALSAIYNSPPLSPQVDIARRLRIEGPTLTRMLDTLEKDGLVERLSDPRDRRTKLLKVTPQGERALENIFDIADEINLEKLRRQWAGRSTNIKLVSRRASPYYMQFENEPLLLPLGTGTHCMVCTAAAAAWAAHLIS